MKKWWSVGVVVVLVLAVVCGISMADTAEERAVSAAKAAIHAQKIVEGDAVIVYDPENNKWEERVAVVAKMPADPNHGKLPHGMLYNKKYETVLFDFKEDATEGDVWVFIDKDTGNVLTIYEEKK